MAIPLYVGVVFSKESQIRAIIFKDKKISVAISSY